MEYYAGPSRNIENSNNTRPNIVIILIILIVLMILTILIILVILIHRSIAAFGLVGLQDSSKGGAVETGCSDLYDVIY